ncbi:hypothetical protein K0C01_06425 [Salinarchaeum sp. IM2453]|uniref:hypothetical protein n=1 Tax=Salinarchaeum sp. IM2453 TaxID=2862870 RepID=UPI001C83E606|nr:hypothetical protein [Salinarchaeum sp. IM2453]QZA87462.1 hypothetical protein K0C01_06425 [Salinarchaeum sp. IM2453]
MRLPEGQLLRSQTVNSLESIFQDCIEESRTGYIEIEASGAVLEETTGRNIIVIERGIPRAAYQTGTGQTGREALEGIPDIGPYHIMLYQADKTEITGLTEKAELSLTLIIEQFIRDQSLAEELRERNNIESRSAANNDRLTASTTGNDGLSSFFEDESRIDKIQSDAREQAREQASEFGLENMIESTD